MFKFEPIIVRMECNFCKSNKNIPAHLLFEKHYCNVCGKMEFFKKVIDKVENDTNKNK